VKNFGSLYTTQVVDIIDLNDSLRYFIHLLLYEEHILISINLELVKNLAP